MTRYDDDLDPRPIGSIIGRKVRVMGSHRPYAQSKPSRIVTIEATLPYIKGGVVIDPMVDHLTKWNIDELEPMDGLGPLTERKT